MTLMLGMAGQQKQAPPAWK